MGGGYKMSFRNFTTGKSMSFGGQYLELVPGEIEVTVVLKPVSAGTELTIVQEIPD
jgi:hypothetical protein